MSGHTATPRGWENGARTKIIFHATLAHGDWWQIFNPANEMALLARETDEARAIVDTLNSHADLVRALGIALRELDYVIGKHGYVSTETAAIQARAALATLTARKVG